MKTFTYLKSRRRGIHYLFVAIFLFSATVGLRDTRRSEEQIVMDFVAEELVQGLTDKYPNV